MKEITNQVIEIFKPQVEALREAHPKSKFGFLFCFVYSTPLGEDLPIIAHKLICNLREGSILNLEEFIKKNSIDKILDYAPGNNLPRLQGIPSREVSWGDVNIENEIRELRNLLC